MPMGPQGQPLPYGPPGQGGVPNAAPNPMAANPFMTAQPPKEPIVSAGEDAITKLLQMASGNPLLLIGLSMAGAAREISQLTGLSRRRQGGAAGGKGPAQPSAAAMLGGNMGDLDRMIALQSMMGGAPAPPMGGQMPGGMPPGMPMGGAPPMPGMPPGMPPGGGLPPQFAGLV